jgi:hypothetical protein
MWEKPDGEYLLPEFLRETMDCCKAAAIYFGLPALTAYLALRYRRVPFTSWVSYMPYYYAHTLKVIFTRDNLFYLLHLGPALVGRYVICKRRFSVKEAVALSLLIDFAAIVVIYPFIFRSNAGVLKHIYLYSAFCPLLMTFFTLRIDRMRVSGGCVIFLFVGLLCWRFF